MTGDPLAKVLAKHEFWEDGEYVLNCKCGVKFYPDQKGAYHAHVADVVRAFLAEHVAKPEVVEAAAEAIKYSQETAVYMTTTLKTDARAALAAVLETLGGESNE